MAQTIADGEIPGKPKAVWTVLFYREIGRFGAGIARFCEIICAASSGAT
jgi:hypothetical protein